MSAQVERNQSTQSPIGGLRRLLANLSARDISRALVRREAPATTSETTRLSMFGHGQDTRIQNSTVNTTVNYNYTLRSPLEGNNTDGIPPQSRVQPSDETATTLDASPSSIGVEPNNDNAQSPTPEQKVTPRDTREVYIDIMITKSRGFPLWIPSPNTFLPPEYRHSGVSIGDVGVLTPEGAFDFIFNIFADASDPVHANSGLTEGFIPLRPPLHHYEIQRFKENVAGTLVGDDSFERTDDAQDASKVVLKTLASEAAVLMMPEDVYVVRLKNQERLRTYVSAHITFWYSFVKRTLGRDIANGDLRVVYGFRKSTAFGIAAISTAKNPTETRLMFRENESWARQSGYKYRWSQTGSADIKTGPEYKESAELMHPAYGTSTTIPENQCLFISTVDAKLSEEAWKAMELLPVPVVDAMSSSASSASLPSLSHESRQNPSLDLHNTKTDGGEGHSLAVSSKNFTTQVLLGQLVQESTIHPSNILNDVLLATNPEARISIVCDNDWADYMDCHAPLEFVSRILCESRTSLNNGVVYLDTPLDFGNDITHVWDNLNSQPDPENSHEYSPRTSDHQLNTASDSQRSIDKTRMVNNLSDLIKNLVTGLATRNMALTVSGGYNTETGPSRERIDSVPPQSTQARSTSQTLPRRMSAVSTDGVRKQGPDPSTAKTQSDFWDQKHGPSYITAHFADVILSDIRSIKLTPEGLRAINGLLDELLAKILNTSSSLVTHKLRDGLLGLLPTTPGREFLLQAEAKLKAHWQRTEESSAPEDDSLTFNLQWALSLLRVKCEAYSTFNTGGGDRGAERRLNQMLAGTNVQRPDRYLLDSAAWYMTAILEAFCEHILSNVARVAARDSSRAFATVNDIYVALSEDESIHGLFKTMKVYGQIEQVALTSKPPRRGIFSPYQQYDYEDKQDADGHPGHHPAYSGHRSSPSRSSRPGAGHNMSYTGPSTLLQRYDPFGPDYMDPDYEW